MRISKIKYRFNQAANTYNLAAIPQKSAALDLINVLKLSYPTLNPTSILDLGCGTGFMTEQLLDLYPNAEFILNDLAEDMLTNCKQKFAQQRCSYLQGDMDQITIPEVSLIVSNFSLQWSNNIKLCMQRLKNSSKILAFNCLVSGSFSEWQALFPQQVLMHYPSVDELSYHILSLNPKSLVFTRQFPLYSPNPHAFMRQLKQIGATTPLESPPIQHLKNVLKSNTPIHTKYNVLFAIMENNN